MDFFKKNRARAAVCLVIIIALSVIFGALRSFSSLEARVDREFIKKDRFGETVSSTYSAFSMHLRNFVLECEKAMGDDADIKELSSLSAALAGTAFTEKADFGKIPGLIVSAKEKLELTDNYSSAAENAFKSIDNDISILKKYDNYNKAANKYNAAINSFIGSLLNKQEAVAFN